MIQINRIIIYTNYNVNQILYLAIETKITNTLPLKVHVHIDVRELRKRYEEKLFLVGNLDKMEIAKGGESMRNEIDSKLPFMKETVVMWSR